MSVFDFLNEFDELLDKALNVLDPDDYELLLKSLAEMVQRREE